MRNGKRENVARPILEDCAITFGRESRVAVEPCARRGRVTTCRVIDFRTLRFNGGHACNKLGSRGTVIGADDECGAQAVPEDELGILGKRLVNFDRGIPAVRQRKLKRAPAPRKRIHISVISREICVKEHGCISAHWSGCQEGSGHKGCVRFMPARSSSCAR
jgi:hypothetical protein